MVIPDRHLCLEDLEPRNRILSAGGDSEPDLQWNRIEVSMPTLLYPYRDDGLNGDPATVDLSWLSIQFTRGRIDNGQVAPSSIGSRGPGVFPAKRGGACYLWAPGVWWIRCRVGLDPTGGATKIGFTEIPDPQGTVLGYFNFDRMADRGEARRHSITGPGAPGVKVLSVQELLEIHAVTIQAVGNASWLKFEQDFTGAQFFQISLNSIPGITLEGATLPLADIWMQASGTSINVRLLIFY